ncbi:hypothetical protein [Stenotrophobium rhamnosiphilum]|uniref:Uncharacterized protein n=1 Tax=Stenotrophobium rhamnosiphilum TaxID=2029166 RepID=A0A2T5MH96_9GAMM|nr:hypothetical protein [Stenotrophobium rhamnosiphilum]PTU31944.1 hypothetical protein CJD38_04470 [Stenotrophobium rhamnosiphilum]
MNRASPQKILKTTLHWAPPIAAVMLSACSYLMPQPPPKPAKLQRPAVVVDTQQKERARQALQKATSSSNEYSACVMFSTSTHRGNHISATEVAAAACANCAPKLDDYEKGMLAYYEDSPVKTLASAKERAHDRRVELEQTTRDAAIRSLAKAN